MKCWAFMFPRLVINSEAVSLNSRGAKPARVAGLGHGMAYALKMGRLPVHGMPPLVYLGRPHLLFGSHSRARGTFAVEHCSLPINARSHDYSMASPDA